MKTENLNSDQADVMGCKKGAAVKVLNLYAGIGGNRKLWTNCEVTAVELNESIAAIYKDFFPDDKVIVGDAHDYLIKHFREFDFIWTSPPCPTHSKMNTLNNAIRGALNYPDMKLYQEIIILQHFFKGKYVVENVMGYYKPLITPQENGRHYFWANFLIPKIEVKNGIPIKDDFGVTTEMRKKSSGFDIKDFHGLKINSRVIFRNCVDSELGLHIFNCAKGIIIKQNEKQTQLF